MGWVIVGLARLALLVLWVTTPLVSHVFQNNWIVPLLGLIFLPITSLVYIMVHMLNGAVTGWAWAWIVAAVFADFAAHAQPAASSRRRRTLSDATA